MGDTEYNNSSSNVCGYDNPLYSYIEGPPDVPAFGFSVEYLGDVQNDGYDDLLIGTAFDFGYSTRYRAHHEYPDIPYWAEDEQANFYIDGRSDGNVRGSDLEIRPGMSSFWSGSERWLGDVNGDGYDDVVSCLWTTNESTTETDPIQDLDIWFGTPNGLPEEPNDTIHCSVSDRNGPPSSCPIIDFSGIGDVNGDGFNDLMVVFGFKWMADERQVIYEFGVFHGSGNGFDDQPNWVRSFTSSEGVFSISIGGLEYGDFNGDGFSDILWYNPLSFDQVSNRSIFHNDVFVLYGSENGLEGDFTNPLTTLIDYYVEGMFKRLDINGDSIDDIIVHLRSYNPYEWGNATEEHRLVVFKGSKDGLLPVPYQELLLSTINWNDYNSSSEREKWTSFQIAPIDVDNDGSDEALLYELDIYADYQISSPQYIRIGILEEADGYVTANTSWEHWFNIEIRTEMFVNPVVDIGDFDGDGIDDIALGFANYTAIDDLNNENLQRPAGSGHVYIVYGCGIAERMRPVQVKEGPRLFADYKAYGIMVNANPGFLYTTTSREIRMTIDPYDANVTLMWNRTGTTDEFSEFSDPENILELIPGDCRIIQDTRNDTMLACFRVIFKWDWPHEGLCDVEVTSVYEDGRTVTVRAEDIFWIENDLDLAGTPEVFGEWNGFIEEHDWVRVGESLTLTGLSVVYEGTLDTYPPSNVCKFKLHDDDGDSIAAQMLNGVPVNVSLVSDPITDLDETLTLDIIDLPGTARAVSNVTFHLGVDGDLPVFKNPVPNGEDWYSSHEVMISITADDTLMSGVDASTLEYSYSVQDKPRFSDWTRDALQTTPSGPTVDGLISITFPDGDSNFIRWRTKDLVGNGYVVSEEYRIKVDTLNVTFTDPFPSGWQNETEIGCGVTIRDNFGSGIDIASVQYRISFENLSHYETWNDWDGGNIQDALEVSVNVDILFPEGQFSYIQWRAMDIAGNGYTTSPHYLIWVDNTPPEFLRILPAEGEKQSNGDVLALVEIREDLSGLDTHTLQYKLTLDGEQSFGGWIDINIIEDVGKFIGSFELVLNPGLNNTLQIRSSDIAGNEALSEIRRIWVNRAPIARMLSPTNGTEMTFGENLTLDGTTSWDPDEDEIAFEWYINDEPVPVSTDGLVNVTLEVGWNKVLLIVTDIDEASASTEVTILVIEPVEPTTESTFDVWWIAVIVLIIALVVSIVLYLKKRMGRT